MTKFELQNLPDGTVLYHVYYMGRLKKDLPDHLYFMVEGNAKFEYEDYRWEIKTYDQYEIRTEEDLFLFLLEN